MHQSHRKLPVTSAVMFSRSYSCKAEEPDGPDGPRTVTQRKLSPNNRKPQQLPVLLLYVINQTQVYFLWFSD